LGLCLLEQAEIVVGFGQCGVERQRLALAGLRLRELPDRAVRFTEVAQIGRPVRA
jgi:hypothetical protein